MGREVLEYITGVGVTWSESAAKHGVPREDALHAIANAVYVEEEFDDPRPPSNVRPVCLSAHRAAVAYHCSK